MRAYVIVLAAATILLSAAPSFSQNADQATTTVTLTSPAVEVCPVSDPTPAPVKPTVANYLEQNFDFHGADLGMSTLDPSTGTLWIFFGDSMAADSVAWFGGGNEGGADGTGYLIGRDAFNPASLCNNMKMASVPGMTSSYGGAVWSPDMVTANPKDSIGNYIFQGLTSNGGLPYYPTTNSEIPGTNEVSTGSFFHLSLPSLFERGPVWDLWNWGASKSEGWGGNSIYIFYAGSPADSFSVDSKGNPSGALGLPRVSVSYLSAWINPSPDAAFGFSPTSFDVLARVDYTLANPDTTICPADYPKKICPPTVPVGWEATAPTPPLGGHFVYVASQMGNDGFLYLFATGTYRASFIYVARIPEQSVDLIGKCASSPCYLVTTPGFQIWTTSTPGGTMHWSPENKPPSAEDVANAAPLVFGDDPNPDYGELSVRYYKTSANTGLWLMMATTFGNPNFSAKVFARWAISPTGPWSNAAVAFDFSDTDPTGIQNETLYCCQGQSNGGVDPRSGKKIWQCLGLSDGSPVQQCVECQDNSNLSTDMQTTGTPGTPRYGFYAPDLLPYPIDVSNSSYIKDGMRYDVSDFTVNFLMSVFSPYNSVLMKFSLRTTTSSPLFDPFGF